MSGSSGGCAGGSAGLDGDDRVSRGGEVAVEGRGGDVAVSTFLILVAGDWGGDGDVKRFYKSSTTLIFDCED